MRQSSRGFAYKFAYRIRIYSFEAKFAAKFIANLALFLSHEAKFTTRENTGRQPHKGRELYKSNGGNGEPRWWQWRHEDAFDR